MSTSGHDRDEMLRRWVPGEGPVAVEPSFAGLVNDNWRVTRGDSSYSVRTSRYGSGIGVDRSWECQVLRTAAAAGLAPRVEHCEPAQGILVTEWVNGRPWTSAEIRQAQTIHAMAQLLRRIHALSVPQPPRIMSPAAWIAHYADAFGGRDALAPARWIGLRAAADRRLAMLLPQPVAAVLCHGDLHALNVVIGERVVLLDWEYAHVSDPFWDLAGWIANNDWSDDAADRLAASYLGRPMSAAEGARLEASIWLYDYVCLMWSELYLSQRHSDGRRQDDGDRLVSMGWQRNAVERAAAARQEVSARADLVASRLTASSRPSSPGARR